MKYSSVNPKSNALQAYDYHFNKESYVRNIELWEKKLTSDYLYEIMKVWKLVIILLLTNWLYVNHTINCYFKI